VGGIRYQIGDGIDGFLVSSIRECAERIVQLIRDEPLRRRIGEHARTKVKNNFLLTRSLEDYIDLFSSFETIYCLRGTAGDR
jgi:trehalose synthase